MLKHCFTGKFHDDSSSQASNINIETPMTQPETSGVLKLVKDMVFSDLMKLAKNAWNNQNSFDENKNSFQVI